MNEKGLPEIGMNAFSVKETLGIAIIKKHIINVPIPLFYFRYHSFGSLPILISV